MNDEKEKEPRESDNCMEKKGFGNANGKKDPKNPTLKDRLNDLKQNKFSLVIVILCILVIILFIVIIVLAVKLGARRPITVPYCSSSQCLSTAASIKSGLLEDLDPCDDFWQYSCGKWVEENKIPSSRGSYSVSDKITDDLYKKLSHLMNLIPWDFAPYKPEYKLKTFYATCMDLKDIESRSSTPMKDIIESKLKGWDYFGTFFVDIFDMEKVLQALHVDYGVSAFFKIDVVPHPKLPNKAILQISQSGLGLQDASMYFKSEDDAHIVAYKTFIEELLKGFESDSRSSLFVSNIFNYEKRLAEVSASIKQLSQMTGQVMTIAELKEIAPRISWLELLDAYFREAKLTDSSEILVQSPQYLVDISTIISSSDEKVLNTYMIWRFVAHYSQFLSEKFTDVYRNYNAKLLGTVHLKDRWYSCLDQTYHLFGYAFGAMYTRKYYNDEIGSDLKKISKTIINTVADNIKNARWMDGRTKESALKKVKEIVKYVGYPPIVLDEKELTEYYFAFTVQKAYFQNILNSVKFQRKIKEKYLTDGLDGSNYYPPYASSHQPSYQVVMNNLAVPFGVIELPNYNSELPDSLKYGSVGALISQQIMRSIDKIGSMFDEFGAQNEWWSNTTIRKYNLLQDCLIDFYSGFTVDGVQMNGNLTVTNNIDDLIGLRQAYKAYLEAGDPDDEKPLPGTSLNARQQFFVSYAQTMCEGVRNHKLKTDKYSSVYPPNRVRVQAAAELLPEFGKAFDCKYRSPPCKVW